MLSCFLRINDGKTFALKETAQIRISVDVYCLLTSLSSLYHINLKYR